MKELDFSAQNSSHRHEEFRASFWLDKKLWVAFTSLIIKQGKQIKVVLAEMVQGYIQKAGEKE